MALLVIGALGLLGLGLRDRWRTQDLRTRLADRILDLDEDEDPESLWQGAADLLQLARMQALVARSPLARQLALALLRGEVGLGFGQVVGLLLALGAVGGTLGVLFGPHPAVGVAGFIAPLVAGWMLIQAQADRKVERRERQLPAFCTQMLSALRTGSTPLSALQAAARVATPPLGNTLKDLLNALQLGVAPAVAWKDWAHRCGGDHAHILATGIRLKWEAGGQMTAMLEHILESMVARERMVLRVGTLTAQAKMGSYVLSLLPLVFMLYSYKVNPRIFEFMIGDPIGRMALWAGGGLIVAGFFWLRRLAKLEF